MARIYTKTGDGGETALVGGQRVSKADLRIELYGTVDELNSFIGSARSCLLQGMSNTQAARLEPLDTQLMRVQNRLFNLGSLLAALPEDRTAYQLPALRPEDASELEKGIDTMTSELPELKNFILPGGHLAASQLHICRTVARRCERILVRYQHNEELPNHSVVYLNRLSDYFFVAARWVNLVAGITDVKWTQS